MSSRWRGFPWLSQAIRLNRPSRSAGLPNYILCPYRAHVDVLASLPTPARPCEGVHRRMSRMSSSLLLQQCSICLVRRILAVLEMGCSGCFVGYCFQDLFHIARNILVQLPSNFFSMRFVSVYLVHPYSSRYTTARWKKMCLISSKRTNFHITDNLSIADHAFARSSYLFPFMRRCFRSKWICPLVSKNHLLLWRCLLFDFD